MPDAISQALAGHTVTSVGNVFDDYFSQCDVIIARIETEAATYSDINPYKLVLYVLSLGLKALAGLSAAIGFSITVFAKVALAIIIALGPIFIALSLFETTRRLFHGWLGQAFTFIVLMAVIIAITALITDLGATARSAEHTSELQSLMRTSYAVLCLKKKITNTHSSIKKKSKLEGFILTKNLINTHYNKNYIIN